MHSNTRIPGSGAAGAGLGATGLPQGPPLLRYNHSTNSYVSQGSSSSQQEAQNLIAQSLSDATTYSHQYNQQQTLAQKQAQIIADIERAVRIPDAEFLQNIIDDFNADAQSDQHTGSHQHHNQGVPKKELNKALLTLVQCHSSSNKKDLVQDCINVLLNAGANVDVAEPVEGKTPLMIACERGFIETIDFLIEQEASVNQQDKRQRTPIHFALESPGENDDVIVHLIKRGAEVNMASLEGWTPLLRATQKEYHNTMKILLDHGANPKAKVNATHYTPLHIACENGDLHAVKILVEHGGVDLDAQSKTKLTPLELTGMMLQEKTQGNFAEISSYLQGVQQDLEKKAQKVKDELVKQEDLIEERERKKLKARQQNQTKSSGYGRQPQQVTQASSHQTSTASQPQEENKTQSHEQQYQNEEEKKLTATQHHKMPSEEEQQQFLAQQQEQFALIQRALQQQQDSNHPPICNPLSVELLGFSPKIEISNPFNQNQQMSLQQYQQFLAMMQQQQQQHQGSATDLWNNNPLFLQQLALQQQMLSQSVAQQAVQQQHQQQNNTQQQQQRTSAPQTKQSPMKPTANTVVQSTSNNNSGKKQGATQTTSNQQYPTTNPPTQAPQQTQASGGQQTSLGHQEEYQRNLAAQNAAAAAAATRKNQGQQYEQQQLQQQPSNRKQSANYPAPSTATSASTQQNPARQNKSLPFPNNAPAAQQRTTTTHVQQPVAAPPPQQQQQYPPTQQIVIQAQQPQQQQMQMLPQSQLQKNILPTQQAAQITIPPQLMGYQPHLALQNQAAFMMSAQQTAALQQNQAPGQQQFYLLNMQPFSAPMPTQLAALGNPAAAVLNQQALLQQFQLQNQTLAQPLYVPQQQQQTQQRRVNPAPPITDELDLSDTMSMTSFIQDQKLYYTQHRLEEKERDYNTLYAENQALQVQYDCCNSNLTNADNEIMMLKNENYNLIQDHRQKQEQLRSDLTKQSQEDLEAMRRHYTYELSRQREQVEEMKKHFLMFHNMQQRTVKVVQQSYEESRPVRDQEYEELKINLSQSQNVINQLLLSNPGMLGQQIRASMRGAQFTPPSTSVVVPQQRQNGISIQSNRLILMMERFENQSQDFMLQDQNDVYNKLHLEILQYRDSVREILAEMQPLKEQLIENISAIIQKALPNSEVKVYGSHATKLCLPWSDIDLVIITNQSLSGIKGIQDHPKSVLSLINQELKQELQNKWVSQVTFVDNATVPVVKVNCHIKDLLKQQASLFNEYEKYKIFLEQPFNIDITQMTDHHNGLECVKLVQDYLAENEVIEPLILVLKQLLKACNLNNPYFGGLSSYALFLMIVSFLQSTDTPRELSKVNLGRVIVQFLSFYGPFDNEQYGISCRLPLSRQPNPMENKPNNYPILNFMMLHNSNCVQIDDPLNNHNNVGKSSFKFYEIKYAFDYAYKNFFLGCFCDCHNHSSNESTASFYDALMPSPKGSHQHQIESGKGGSSLEIDFKKRQCDSILSRIIYSYKIMEGFLGPVQHIMPQQNEAFNIFGRI